MQVPEPLLRLIELGLIAIVYLFFLRVLRAVWAQLKEPAVVEAVAASTMTAPKEQLATTKRGSARTLRISEPASLRGKEFQILDEMTVGRGTGCTVTIDDSYASSVHVRIFRQDGQAYAEDLGSTNGSFLNRRKVTSPTPIHHGDRLQIGRTVFEVKK